MPMLIRSMPLLLRAALRSAAAAALCCSASQAQTLPPLPPPSPITLLIESEPNARLGQAQRIELGDLGAVVTGTLKRAADVDSYRLDLAIGTCVVNLLAPSPLADHDLQLLNGFGLVLLRSSNRGAGQIELLPICGLPLSTTYYLRVVYAGGAAGLVAGAYAIGVGDASLLPVVQGLAAGAQEQVR